MPRIVPEDYFSAGAFKSEGGFGFRSFTCIECSHRSATWDAFREHRLSCPGRVHGQGPQVVGGDLSREDREALLDLLAQADPIDMPAAG